MTNEIQMINIETNESRPVPVLKITEYLVAGWVPAADPTPSTPANRDFPPVETFGEVEILGHDVDASDAVDADVANYVSEGTKENVVAAPKLTRELMAELLADPCMVDAAISYLGDCQTADELANGSTQHLNGAGFSAAYGKTGQRMWMWVTGKDPKTFEARWPVKSLSHSRATGCFRKYISNHGLNDAVELGRKVALVHWKQLGHMLEDGFKAEKLPSVDPVRKPKPPQFVSIKGAEIKGTSGKATKILWDSRMIWIPTSKIKHINGAISIPGWLAEAKEMI